jgi:hypothetical protein
MDELFKDAVNRTANGDFVGAIRAARRGVREALVEEERSTERTRL